MVGNTVFTGYVGQNENWWHILLYTSERRNKMTALLVSNKESVFEVDIEFHSSTSMH